MARRFVAAYVEKRATAGDAPIVREDASSGIGAVYEVETRVAQIAIGHVIAARADILEVAAGANLATVFVLSTREWRRVWVAMDGRDGRWATGLEGWRWRRGCGSAKREGVCRSGCLRDVALHEAIALRSAATVQDLAIEVVPA